MAGIGKKIVLVSAFLALSFPAASEVVDKIAVVVNDEMITLSEIDSMVAPVYNEYKNAYKGDELAAVMAEARRKAVEQLIEQKLLVSAARKDNIEVSEKEVDAYIDEVKKRFPSSGEFEQALAAEKTSLKELRTRYRSQLLTRKFIDKKVAARIVISPAETKAYYDAHPEEFGEPEIAKARNILIKVKGDADSDKKAQELARTISARLREGQDFEALARTYSEGPGASDGGLMGYVKKGDLKKELDDAIFKLLPGETSDVMRTELGYHIFRVEEKSPAKVKDLSSARNEAENRIFRNKISQGVKDLVKKLKKDAYIVFK